MRRVKVIGAGIGGLVTAIGLQRRGVDVTVFERASSPGPVGAGLSLFGNAFTALDAIGAGDAVRALGGPQGELHAGQRRPDGRWLSTIPPDAVAELRVVHRADLHRVLAGELAPGTIRWGSPTTAELGEFDVVVAADGLRSQTRSSWPDDPGVRYAGYSTWRGVTARPVDVGGEAGETVGRGERFGMAPLPDGRVYWFGVSTMPLDATFADEYQEVRRRFAGWHAPIADLFDATEPSDVFRTGIFELAGPLPSFRRGRVVLLGDAAHAMTPDLGQGANQAIEDAATLSLLLAGSADIDAALSEYDRLRRPRTQRIAGRAHLMGRLMQSRSPLRNLLLRLTPPQAVARQLRSMQSWQPPAAAEQTPA
ncbi:FAD-dependent monooxygenase [Actinoplanes sp. NPDC051633]|uniref:FAD-dependent monooxygenase n=1 Tax=Actinoplanes sp. NPDC051633 TaxID=3155670 RepID=UPI0034478C7F